jgi:glutamyl-tRNA reductase
VVVVGRVLVATSSPHAILGAEELVEVMRLREQRALVLIDIAVPRDIEPESDEIPGITRYDIDDLQAVVARNLEVRDGERANAEAVVEEEIQRFARWMGQLDVRPTVAALREHGAAIVEEVLAENAGRWESLSARDRVRVESVARAVMQRLLHEPTLRLKAEDGGHGRQQLLLELFGLEESPSAPADADTAAEADNVRAFQRRA